MSDSYAVFKAVNKRRREIYLGMTRLPVFETLGELHVGVWGRGEDVSVESLEAGLTRGEAQLSLAKRLKAPPPKGWRYAK